MSNRAYPDSGIPFGHDRKSVTRPRICSGHLHFWTEAGASPDGGVSLRYGQIPSDSGIFFCFPPITQVNHGVRLERRLTCHLFEL